MNLTKILMNNEITNTEDDLSIETRYDHLYKSNHDKNNHII